MMECFNWYFPPTKNKQGQSRTKYDIKQVCVDMHSTLFDQPVIAMSDIHSQTKELLEMLDEFVHLEEFVVLTCGDMAGGYVMGTDGDPTEFYEFLAEKSKEFYFVQGNHDNYNIKQKQITNKQMKKANIGESSSSASSSSSSSSCVVKSLIGSIAGVNGIISDKSHPFKMSSDTYVEKLKKALEKKPKILLTHDTPSIILSDGTKYIGNDSIFGIITKGKPKVHFYGHCHHPTFYNTIGNVTYVNLDGRVIIFVPECSKKALFKKEITNVYSPLACEIKSYTFKN